MEFKKLLNKVHDKVSHTSLPVNSPTPTPTRRRSFKDKKQATLTRLRDKWGDVPRPRFFSINNNTNTSKDTDFRNSHVFPSSSYASSPQPLPQIPTITLSSPTLLQRSKSTIAPRPPPPALTPTSSKSSPNYHFRPRQKQRPISYTPRQTQRLSVPHVVDHLRSPYHSTIATIHNDDSDNVNSKEENDAGSFYDIPIMHSPSPSRQVTWYIPTRKTSLDDTTNSSLENDSVTSMMSTNPKSSMSSSSSSSIIALTPKDGSNRPTEGQYFPLSRQDSAFLGNEIIQPHKESSHDTDDDDDDDDDDRSIITTDATATCHDNDYPAHQLATLNVSNTMMMMREHQLELQVTRLRIENQRLQQQMDDMISGTWSSTTQLLAENDRLELQIQQLQKQQRLVRSSITGKGELLWRDEQEALRHTRAQLGLVEYLEGEPDVMAALNRFKKLLTTSC
ncbi:hypothetical protein BCR42DRAFT_487291 [Absidia repens]|uniref:Uncharacterized protein n=1 Tax=Absidia repens TaxID=90262 RepID=A0A1X2IW73_9FUNG|nr:hypothetical protein BCR42DRAFT_487291 [Absidia repens]